MCGIFGFTNYKEDDLAKARASLDLMSHRGPDQWSDYKNESVYMGHRRLSILDLSVNGRQPMTNEQESVWVTVNGEIYNFKSIREELKNKYKFNSNSDSEVVLHGYSEWGIQGLLQRIDGMFAFSIFDKSCNKIFLVRDRVGIKPIHYSVSQNRFHWASELEVIASFLENKNLEIDYTSVYDFLTYQYVPTPKTLYKSIYKLEPGHFIEFDINTKMLSKNKYWNLETSEINVSDSEAEQHVYHLLKKSVEEQMVSDVPVGFFLSGGMDSSTVVGLAREINKNINTFTIGFSNDPNDETPFAQTVANHFSTNHVTRILDGSTTATMFPKIKEWYDEPFGDISCFPTYLVSKIARESATVVLTGDGGDELFAGYKWYAAFRMLKRFNLRSFSFLRLVLKPFLYKRNKVGRIAKKIEWLVLNDLELYTRLMGGLLRDEKDFLRRKWNIPDTYDDYWYFRKYYREDLPVVKRLQYLDFHTYLHDDILTKVDRVSMAVSLECRVPFLSKELIEYVFSLPQDTILKNGVLKGLMKSAFSKLLPHSVINRDKRGFSPPVSVWGDELYQKHKTRHFKILQDVFNIDCHPNPNA